MGILTDFFLATTSDVDRVLPGWQLPPAPLPEPVVVKVVNPFTKQTIEVKTRRDRAKVPEPNAAALASPDIRALPTVQCKGMLPDKLAIVFATLSGVEFDEAHELVLCGDLIGPPDNEIVVLQLPDGLTASLASASSQDLARAAQAVEEADVEGLTTSPENVAILTEILAQVQNLAATARAQDARLFLWICP